MRLKSFSAWRALAAIVGIVAGSGFASSAARALPPLHNPVPITAPAWGRVLGPYQTLAVPMAVCPYGISDLHVYNRGGRGYVQTRDGYGPYWARRGGIVVARWSRTERTFISMSLHSVVVAVWCG